MIAQQLYEGVELPGEGSVGLITYMRTDSTRVVGPGARRRPPVHRRRVRRRSTCPEKPNVYKTKSDAQDAHEAIRPTSMQYHPDAVRAQLTPDQYYLYKLIWNRFVASQMPPATFDETTVDVAAADYLFRVKGSVPKFPGWMAVYEPARSRRSAPTIEDERRARTGRAHGGRRRGFEPAAAAGQGRRAHAARAEAGAEVHAAAAALHRGDAGEGARGERHRPSVHLRVDHHRDPGARVREQDRGQVQADRSSA